MCVKTQRAVDSDRKRGESDHDSLARTLATATAWREDAGQGSACGGGGGGGGGHLAVKREAFHDNSDDDDDMGAWLTRGAALPSSLSSSSPPPSSRLLPLRFLTAVVDEAHFLKNLHTQQVGPHME